MRGANALPLADHDALVTTPLPPETTWPCDCEGSCVAVPVEGVLDCVEDVSDCAVVVPAPSDGSWPCAIWVARPPKIPAAAANDTAMRRTLAVPVDIRDLMRASLPATSQRRLRAALDERKNHGPIRKRSARAEPP